MFRFHDAPSLILSKKYCEGIHDELVKSHIPCVVHASTKPVLSEPSTLREPPFESLRANGEPKGSCFDKLSTNGISIGYPALRGIHPEPFLRLRSGHSEKPFTLSVSKGERLFSTGRSKGDADFLRDHLIYIIGIFLEILICK